MRILARLVPAWHCKSDPARCKAAKARPAKPVPYNKQSIKLRTLVRGTTSVTTSTTQPSWRNVARAWGIFCLAALFGVGAFFLVRRSLVDWHDVLEQGTAGQTLLGALYAVLALIGLVKGEI